VVLVVAVAAVYFYRQNKGERVVEDLVVAFSDTSRVEKKSSIALELAFKAGPETIKGDTRPGIYMHPNSRLIFHRVTIPDSGHLRVALGVKEEAWDKPSDGVLFRFGISDGRTYEELLNQLVDPANNPNDRMWRDVENLDLSAYAGQQVDLVFNTEVSAPRRVPNGVYDFAVWGAPALVVKH
jgi:hypothetical protein